MVCARVFRVERSDEDGLVAVVVELVVDGALGEDGSLEFVEGAGDFGVLACAYEAVFEDIAELQV